jgi:hypothetical protein
VIGSLQKPLPAQHTTNTTGIYAFDRIRTRNPSSQVATDLHKAILECTNTAVINLARYLDKVSCKWVNKKTVLGVIFVDPYVMAKGL